MIAVVLLVALLLVTGCGDDGQATAAPNPLVAALRQGGHTLVMRHATTDPSITGQERLGSCASQRNLTEEGREQARAIGRAVRTLGIPIDDVRASPLCRTRQTARLAFLRATDARVLVSPGVIGTEAGDRRRGRRLRALTERSLAPGENDVLVTHTGSIREALGEETVAEGETLVFGRGGRLVGRVTAEEWTELAEAAGG